MAERHALWYARKHRGLTLQQLAERSGLSIGGVHKIETGEVRNPHALTKRALADALGYRPVDIWPVNGGRPHTSLRPAPLRRGTRNGGRKA